MKWRDRDPRLSAELDRWRSLQPHEVLKISPDASKDEIKAAYRRAASLYHPDRADTFMKKYNAEILRILNEAYDAMLARRERSND